MTNKSQTQQSMEQDPRKFQIECVLEEHSNLLSVSTPDQSGSHPNLAGSIKKNRSSQSSTGSRKCQGRSRNSNNSIRYINCHLRLGHKTYINPYPKIVNSGQFVMDSNKSTEEITIRKIRHNMKLKEYAVMSVVDSVIQYYLQKVFRIEIVANMLTSDNFVLNKYTALQMQQHLDTKFNKLNPNHIKDVMIGFEFPPLPDAQIGSYFVKQNTCISLLANTDESITNPKQQQTLLGNLLAIPLMQQAVDNYNKLVQAERTKLWNDTQLFSIKEDLNTTDNFQTLSKAGIRSAHSVITNERIDQLHSHTSDLIEKNATYETALTKNGSCYQ